MPYAVRSRITRFTPQQQQHTRADMTKCTFQLHSDPWSCKEATTLDMKEIRAASLDTFVQL